MEENMKSVYLDIPDPLIDYKSNYDNGKEFLNHFNKIE